MENVLVIGGGPSYREHLEECRNFKGTIVCCDSPANFLIKNGIYPDYIITIETEVSLDFFNIKEIKKHGTTIVYSAATKPQLIQKFKESQLKTKVRVIRNEISRYPSVGITALVYTKEDLKADKILLLGFENEGEGYSERTFLEWRTAFWGFVVEWPQEYIVNCSEGGILYGKCRGKRVKRSTLSEVNAAS